MSKILSVLAIVLGVLLGLKYFKVYNIGPVLPFDLLLVASIYLIITQIFFYVQLIADSQGVLQIPADDQGRR